MAVYENHAQAGEMKSLTTGRPSLMALAVRKLSSAPLAAGIETE